MKWGLYIIFDEVCGMNSNDSYNKAGLILECCELCSCEKRETTLVGVKKTNAS